VISGVVIDSASGLGIAGAEVLVDGTTLRTVTDARGEFRVGAAPKVGGTLRVRRFGFRPATIAVSGDVERDPVRVPLTSTMQQLAAVLVRGERSRYSGRLAGYYERLEQHSAGQFITRAEMERENQTLLSQVLRRAPGVSVGRGHNGVMNSVRLRERNCWPLVWLDGAQMGAGDVDIDSFSPSSLEGVEMYLGAVNAPSRYQASRGKSECGTILLWSRGPDTDPRPAARGVMPEQLEVMISSLSIYTADQVDTPAVLVTLSLPPITYPPSMRATGVNGIVVMEFVVDTSGCVESENLGIVSSTHPLFTEVASEAVRMASFRPAVRRGHKVRQLVRQPFEFHAPRSERSWP
jgi:TonB family protein